MNFSNLDSKTAAVITKYDIHPQSDEHRDCDGWDEKRLAEAHQADSSAFEQIPLQQYPLCCWCDNHAIGFFDNDGRIEPACPEHSLEYEGMDPFCKYEDMIL